MQPKLLVWGTSGHARVVVDIILQGNHYEIFGFLDDGCSGQQGESFLGAPILGGQEQLDTLVAKSVEHIILGVGDSHARLSLSRLACEKGFILATAIHPSAVIASDVEIASGTVIAAGAVINPATRIGRNVIVNTSSSVDHDCVIEEGAHICPGVHLAGNVMVGRSTWVGIGSTVINRVRIGAGSMIGAGSVVICDIPDGVVAFGVPAKVIRKVENNGK